LKGVEGALLSNNCFPCSILYHTTSGSSVCNLQLNGIRKAVSEMAGIDKEKVQVVVSPYRICPLGAHIDHQVL